MYKDKEYKRLYTQLVSKVGIYCDCKKIAKN